VSYGRHADKNYKNDTARSDYRVRLQNHIKNLGVIFDKNLDLGLHIAEKINKAYSMLWLIKRNFKDIGKEAFLLLYKHLVRSHLEYGNSVWAPYKKLTLTNSRKYKNGLLR